MCVGSFFLGVISVIVVSALTMVVLMRLTKVADKEYKDHFGDSEDDEHATQHHTDSVDRPT